MRELKFRTFSITGIGIPFTLKEISTFIPANNGTRILEKTWPEDIIFMQYTGHKLFDGRECYEGDIAFDEVSHDNGDERLYFACTWIKEFGSFCWLHLPGEYNEYLDCGIEHFDESMGNSYNMEGTDRLHYAGNIYEHKHLLL